jgi:predicted metal-binding protein
MKRYTKYLRKTKSLGVKDAKIISAKSIVTAEWVRLKCQFGCGGYGRNLTCPPYSPTPEQTKRMLTDYKYGILIHGDENTPSIKGIVSALERDIFLDGYYKAFGIGAGPCYLCSKCTLKFCRHPKKVRPSMEACGIDVFRTVQANGFPIEVLKSESCKGNYYGVVLIE